MRNDVSVVITSGGNGSRFGRNKMLALIKDKPVIVYAVENFRRSKSIDEIIVIVKKEDKKMYQKIFNKEKLKVKLISAAHQRIDSVYLGVKTAKGKYVITHDGNRPLTPIWLIDKIVEEVKKYKAVISAVAPITTIKYSNNQFIKKSLSRNKTWISQTPHGFEKKLFIEAFEKVTKNKKFIPTDDSEIITKFGKNVRIVPGDEINIKITFPHDLFVAEQLLKTVKQ